MPFKGLALFADVKQKVAKTHRHTITASKVVVICLSIELENFQISVSFYTQKFKFST